MKEGRNEGRKEGIKFSSFLEGSKGKKEVKEGRK